MSICIVYLSPPNSVVVIFISLQARKPVWRRSMTYWKWQVVLLASGLLSSIRIFHCMFHLQSEQESRRERSGTASEQHPDAEATPFPSHYTGLVTTASQQGRRLPLATAGLKRVVSEYACVLGLGWSVSSPWFSPVFPFAVLQEEEPTPCRLSVPSARLALSCPCCGTGESSSYYTSFPLKAQHLFIVSSIYLMLLSNPIYIILLSNPNSLAITSSPFTAEELGHRDLKNILQIHWASRGEGEGILAVYWQKV